MPSPRRVVVVGGAVVDVKLRTAGPAVLGTSNPGMMETTVGGVGRNIAEGLARLGTPTVLVAAVGDDPAADAVLARTTAAGVGCEHLVRSAHPTGTYTAVLDHAGDLVVAVADMRASDELTADDLTAVHTLLEGAGALVLDANPPPEVLSRLVQLARDAGVPVVLEPVSVAKSGALAGVPAPDRPVALVTPNVDELAALVGRPVPDAETDVLAAAGELHRRGVSTVWVRRGAAGSLVSTTEDGAVRAVAVGTTGGPVVDVTGAGDAMTAGYVHALLGGSGVVEAARAGQVCAALTCASPDTVRPDLTAALVAEHLGPAVPPIQELSP
ncbi:carbohydrate kinase family protein [Phycicoccus sp. CSK15P-2]|uniref:carbohydrate kinase family protein n=1 Tax=Phycicoccus sp. CSK15P-2 TaxID=2807627 RepID=UPI0019521298|nr:carbohydrate kinase family protein [Phycicoccus sp. CSK15P-2]MBM6402718.1 carbohydrate kinase family protein [Phycicoccus sp. CSK15P-2]